MAIIIDPTGTPTPVYNRSGITLQTVTPSTMSTTNDPTQYLQLVRECGHTVIISNGAGATGPIGVLLPVGAEIGDVVEIYAEVVNVLAAPAIGESFADFTPTPSSEEGGWNSVSVPPTAGVKFRKTSSSNWKVMV